MWLFFILVSLDLDLSVAAFLPKAVYLVFVPFLKIIFKLEFEVRWPYLTESLTGIKGS